MLVELAVRDLGIIDELRLVLGPGMTVLTGETGAGKTMLVEALELLVGGRADPPLVRPGRRGAEVEGRFEIDGDEVVLTRVVPADGRSRAYVDGRMATAGALAERGPPARRPARPARPPVPARRGGAARGARPLPPASTWRPLHDGAPSGSAEIDRRLADLGGDAGARAREIDLLRYQVDELEAAGLADPDEDDRPRRRGDRAGRRRGPPRGGRARAAEAVAAEGGARDALAAALAAVQRPAPRSPTWPSGWPAPLAEVDDLAAALQRRRDRHRRRPRAAGAVRERRQLLVDLRRKYGTRPADAGRRPAPSPTCSPTATRGVGPAGRPRAPRGAGRRRSTPSGPGPSPPWPRPRPRWAGPGGRRRPTWPPPSRPPARAGHARAPRSRSRSGATDPATTWPFLLAANPGPRPARWPRSPPAASWPGRCSPCAWCSPPTQPTLVFDEVDAGIGGEAAVAVGRALADLAADRQVLVVTHLPQVAAFADAQVT